MIVGPSDIGKTTAARDVLLKNYTVYIKDSTTTTFDHYDF